MTASQPDVAFALLIVEDDRATSQILQRMISLKFCNAAVQVAATGEVGIEMFRESPADIVITDINLPTMDGLEMIVEMKSIRADTNFIVLSGYDIATYADKIGEIGIRDYILKPIDFSKLFAAIAATLQGA